MSPDTIQVTEEGSVTLVALMLPPSLDSEEFGQLNDSLLAVIADHPSGRYVLDLSNLSYLGSSALGLMVNVRQRIKDAGGRLILCGLSPRLLQIFQTCCMERLFTIKPTRLEALRAMGG